MQFIKLLREQDRSGAEGDLCLRLVFCEFLAACTYTTLARAEDNIEQCVSSHGALVISLADQVSYNTISKLVNTVKNSDVLRQRVSTNLADLPKLTSYQSISRSLS